jgi:hypothetical protein
MNRSGLNSSGSLQYRAAEYPLVAATLLGSHQLTIAMKSRGIEDYLGALWDRDRGGLAHLIANVQSRILSCGLEDAGDLQPAKSVWIQQRTSKFSDAREGTDAVLRTKP